MDRRFPGTNVVDFERYRLDRPRMTQAGFRFSEPPAPAGPFRRLTDRQIAHRRRMLACLGTGLEKSKPGFVS
jgi:hypothetical protein